MNIAYATSSWSESGSPAEVLMGSTSEKTFSWVSDIASTIFTGFFDIVLTILPYAIGILVFYIGYRLARRALAGR